jgi:DNA-binding MarR family transcriptional regulator
MEKPKSKREHTELMLELILQLVKFCQAKEQYFANRHNLTTVELRCLQYFKTNHCASVKELSQGMELTSGRITHIITSLEKKKLVTREIDENDRRIINVCLTKKAIPFTQVINKSYVELHEKILENIPINKRKSIIKALEELVRAFIVWNENKK